MKNICNFILKKIVRLDKNTYFCVKLLRMQVLLDIPNQSAWQALQPLIQYLHIGVIETKIEKNKHLSFMKKRTKNEQLALEALLEKGITVPNIESLVRDFEENRQDRTLPFRD